ncbi:MAG: ATP-binding protein [Bacilli bacterium]
MIERYEYLDFLKKLRDKQIIKVITGVRRCGKSTILEQYRNFLLKSGVKKENIISINFEDVINKNLLDWETLHNYILENAKENEMNYIFLDEIQMVDKFERCINSLLLKKYLDIYITGSNSYMLSGELATYLTGRYMELHVLPLSFKEYISFYGETDKLEKYNNYREYGGFPYLIYLDGDKELMRKYIDGVYNTIIMKDVITRNKITDPLILDSIVKFLFNNIGSSVSKKKISDTLASNGRKNSVHTVEVYLNALLESFILYRVGRYDIKGKQFLKTQEKYYLSDLGFRTYLIGKSYDNDLGHILENIVFLELKRRGYQIYIGKSDDLEIDFVVENHDNLKYIQVALSVIDSATLERELKPLQSLSDHYPKYLITLDYNNNDYDGIKQINVIDFLLGKENI